MKLEERIDKYIALYRDEIVQNLCDFVKIPSLMCIDSSPYPYGASCAKALDFCTNLCKEKNLHTINHEYYCSEAMINEHQEGKRLVIASHADVVPPDNNCIYDPFAGEIVDNYIVGRGVVDDKGPLIATIYALSFFKENNIDLKNDIRLLFGSNEEMGMDDMDYYLNKVGQPDFALAVDDDFPVTNGEKGLIQFTLSAKKSTALKEIYSTGEIQRIIHDECTINFENVSYKKVKSESCDNPISKLILELFENGIYVLQDKNQNEKLVKLLENINGTEAKINFEDKKSGKTLIRVFKVSLDKDNIIFSFDVRTPISYDENIAVKNIKDFAFENNFICNITKISPGYFISEDNDIVSMLTKLYNETSKSEDKPYIMGACTYTRKFKNACGFGAGNPHEVKPFPKGHGGAHGKDEAHNIDVLLHAVKMYILGIKAIDDYFEKSSKL